MPATGSTWSQTTSRKRRRSPFSTGSKRSYSAVRSALPVLVALVLVQLPIAAAEPAPSVRQGMTSEEVRAALGKPQRVARQILYGRYQEMWTYEQPSLVRVEFNCL